MVPEPQYGLESPRVSIPVQSKKKSPSSSLLPLFWQLLDGLTMAILPLCSMLPYPYGGPGMFHQNFRRNGAVEAVKHPTTTTTFITITVFCPPCHRQKKLTLIAPLNNNKCPGERFPPLSLTSHQHNARPRNGCPQQSWPSFEDKLGSTIFPTGGQTVL